MNSPEVNFYIELNTKYLKIKNNTLSMNNGTIVIRQYFLPFFILIQLNYK